MQGRKPTHLAMQNGKTNRQRIWDSLRENPNLSSYYKISIKTTIAYETVRTYMIALRRSGHLEVIGSACGEPEFKLAINTGVEAPQLKSNGEKSTKGAGKETMWRTIRILGEFTPSDLVMQCSTVKPVTLSTAKNFIKWLNWAGYLELITSARPSVQARYRIRRTMNTGPVPPVIQRDGRVFDPNLNRVVFARGSASGDLKSASQQHL